MNVNRHKVFISYHHANDQSYKNHFIRQFGKQGADIFVDCSVDTSSINDTGLKTETVRQKIRDDYIRDASVIIVLIGTETGNRKHVDWEIAAGIRDTATNPRCGLLGILLPNSLPNIPPRLDDNVKCSYSKIYQWNDDANRVAQWIDEAFRNKDATNPDNNQVMFGRNR